MVYLCLATESLKYMSANCDFVSKTNMTLTAPQSVMLDVRFVSGTGRLQSFSVSRYGELEN